MVCSVLVQILYKELLLRMLHNLRLPVKVQHTTIMTLQNPRAQEQKGHAAAAEAAADSLIGLICRKSG